MNKQELIKKLEELKFSHVPVVQELSNRSQCYNEAIKAAILLVKKLDEPKKVIVPKFVAEWYEGNKHALDLAIFTQIRMLDGNSYPHESEFDCWLDQSKNNPIETLIRMKDGYEVEKEPLYHIVFTGLGNKGEDCYLWVDKSHNNEVYFSNKPNMGKNKFTEQEIKEIDERYWAFAVPVYK